MCLKFSKKLYFWDRGSTGPFDFLKMNKFSVCNKITVIYSSVWRLLDESKNINSHGIYNMVHTSHNEWLTCMATHESDREGLSGVSAIFWIVWVYAGMTLLF